MPGHNLGCIGDCCDMLLVVANIGSDELLGMEALQCVFATAAGFENGTIVGGRPIDATDTPTGTCSPRARRF